MEIEPTSYNAWAEAHPEVTDEQEILEGFSEQLNQYRLQQLRKQKEQPPEEMLI